MQPVDDNQKPILRAIVRTKSVYAGGTKTSRRVWIWLECGHKTLRRASRGLPKRGTVECNSCWLIRRWGLDNAPQPIVDELNDRGRELLKGPT